MLPVCFIGFKATSARLFLTLNLFLFISLCLPLSNQHQGTCFLLSGENWTTDDPQSSATTLTSAATVPHGFASHISATAQCDIHSLHATPPVLTTHMPCSLAELHNYFLWVTFCFCPQSGKRELQEKGPENQI